MDSLNITKINKDVLNYILEFTNPEDVISVRMCCKSLYKKLRLKYAALFPELAPVEDVEEVKHLSEEIEMILDLRNFATDWPNIIKQIMIGKHLHKWDYKEIKFAFPIEIFYLAHKYDNTKVIKKLYEDLFKMGSIDDMKFIEPYIFNKDVLNDMLFIVICTRNVYAEDFALKLFHRVKPTYLVNDSVFIQNLRENNYQKFLNLIE